MLANEQADNCGINTQRELVAALKARLSGSFEPEVRDLLSVADALVRKSVWIVGGDGWGYDIGFGGLDHVVASGADVNILVLDTEVYSNTGGQSSKSTPLGAVAKFAAGGKSTAKKDLGMMAARYGNVYVAQVAMGASDSQTMKAFLEAEAHDGPSLIIAYSQCIAHGIDIAKGMHQQKLAVDSGHWPLYRYHPARAAEGKNPFQLDSGAPKIPLEDYIYTETRYRMLQQSDPEVARFLLGRAQQAVDERWRQYQQMAKAVGSRQWAVGSGQWAVKIPAVWKSGIDARLVPGRPALKGAAAPPRESTEPAARPPAPTGREAPPSPNSFRHAPTRRPRRARGPGPVLPSGRFARESLRSRRKQLYKEVCDGKREGR